MREQWGRVVVSPRVKRFLAAVLAAGALAASACAQSHERAEEGWRPIALSGAPASPSTVGIGAKFGALIFRGGLKLTSTDRKFGGWSSIKLGKDGHLIALSDQGSWLSLQLDLDPNTGDLIGVSDAKMAALRDTDGAPLTGKLNTDAEGLAHMPDGRYGVSFERTHHIWFYDLDGAGPSAPATQGPPVQAGDLEPNQGLESLTAGPRGKMIAGSEIAPPGQSSSRFYVYELDAPPAQALIVEGPAQTTEGNSLVDMDLLPGGDIVALERFYFPLIGNRTAIRRYTIAGLSKRKPVLAGPLLASFSAPENIDNFEGVAATGLPDGSTRLYIISDDNFSALQQTLLYAFDLPAQLKVLPGRPP